MTIKGFIKKMLVHSCVYFTVAMAAYLVLAAIVNVNDDTLLLDAGRTVLFFVFSVLLSLANTLFSIEKLHMALKIICHYLLTSFGFFVCFMMSLAMRTSQIFVGLVIFTAVYFIILGIVAAFRSRYRANKESSEKYENKHKKQTKK